MPIKNLYAARAVNMPEGYGVPYAPAASAAKTNRMIVDISRDHFREYASAVYPNMS